MFIRRNFGVFLCLSVFLIGSNLELVFGLENGDFCTITSTGKPGICKLITDCTEAIQNLRKGKIPQICGFLGTQSMVCCRQTVKETTKNPPLTTQTSATTVSKGGRRPGEISIKKCKEYNKYVWVEEPPVVFKPGAKPIRRKECPFEKIKLIVGGTLASRREFPHMAQIGYSTQEYPEQNEIFWGCGGSLISETFILTAAHCIYTQYGDARMVRLGITNLTNTNNQDHLQQVRVVDRYAYPDFKRPAHYNDIGLVKLEKSVEMDEYVRPACLHTTDDLPKSKVVACGWGKLQYGGSDSKDLLKVVLELYNQSQCNDIYKATAGSIKLRQGIKEDLMVCAGSSTDIRDTCQGDSGGPLQVYVDTAEIECMYDVVGITSFGQACGLAVDTPGVYTRVSHYLKWIEDLVWPGD